jgi:hypothetical protein
VNSGATHPVRRCQICLTLASFSTLAQTIDETHNLQANKIGKHMPLFSWQGQQVASSSMPTNMQNETISYSMSKKWQLLLHRWHSSMPLPFKLHVPKSSFASSQIISVGRGRRCHL